MLSLLTNWTSCKVACSGTQIPLPLPGGLTHFLEENSSGNIYTDLKLLRLSRFMPTLDSDYEDEMMYGQQSQILLYLPSLIILLFLFLFFLSNHDLLSFFTPQPSDFSEGFVGFAE